MKKAMRAVFASGAIIAATAVTALAAGGPSGTYKTVIQGDSALGGHLNGTWKIKFKAGAYHVSDNGHAITHGTFTISGHRISLTDTGGANACTGTGVYKFKIAGKTLTFTKIKDSKSCAGRAGVLSGHTFTKVS